MDVYPAPSQHPTTPNMNVMVIVVCTTSDCALYLHQVLLVGWLVVLGLTALLDSISVYIGPSLRERGKEEKGQTTVKMSKQPPPAPTASAVGPCPTLIQIDQVL